MAALRMLVVSAARRRIGYVFFIGEKLMDWQVSEKAGRSPEHAAEATQGWINELKPDVVVTEKVSEDSRKGERTKALVGAMARVADHNYVLDVSIERPSPETSKYAEARTFAARYPAIADWLPKRRRFFDNEPRNSVLIDATALAEAVFKGPSTTLAAALG